MRDAVNIKELEFQFMGNDCRVSDVWMTENNEIYFSLYTEGKGWVNVKESELKSYLKEKVDLNKTLKNS
jgi:hypothetical protein